MRDYFMKSERLGFSRWREEDIDLAIGLWGDYEVTRYIDVRGKLSDDQVGERLSKELKNDRGYGVQYWPIFLLDTGEHVGCCGLRPYNVEAGIYEMGFHIRRDFWGRKLANEAARAVIEYAFEVLEVKGLFAGHNPQNTASRNLLQKLGFKYTHDEFYPPTGLNHPSYLLNEKDYKNQS